MSTPTPEPTTLLADIGLAPAMAATIAADVARGDARSLLHELLLRGLWSTVIDEAAPEALHRHGGAVARLLAAGVDLHDLVDVVREAQVDTIYNVAQLIDWPDEGLELGETLDVRLLAAMTHGGGVPSPLPELHASLMERDPAGRSGEPRSPVLRQFGMLDADIRRQITALTGERKFSAAAVLWKQHVGGELKTALAAVQSLAGKTR
ncbi:hypothetical protein IV454_08640 [Massilia antarctica]|uniref:Uncharacterized protein n=1 Tax=Massilia antarctica TaxID=2765360 RepID=A0AA49A9L0_9BURK|nr:hypothetical protein [Massilia antarctica]QPI51559.1 hypothetical protein IV454_08640 [Massilia antarctica]